MIRKEIDGHLETLESYINDEDKVVTYKWLSKELGIHVNLSKQILFEYWNSKRQDKEKENCVTATFLIMGYLEDGEMRVDVVNEDDLATAKKNMNKIISEHVYSLQKNLPQIELLAITDKGDSQQSAIRCNESVIRSDYEMEILRWGINFVNTHKQSKNIEKNLTNKNLNLNQNQKPAAFENPKAIEQNNISKKESTAKITAAKTKDKTQKSAFNNMFAKAIDKQNKEKAVAPGSSDNNKRKVINAKKSPPKPNAWFEAAKKCKNDKEQPANNCDVKSTVDVKSSVDINIKNETATGHNGDSESSQIRKNAWSDSEEKSKDENEQPESGNASKDSEEKEESSKKNTSSGKIGGKNKTANSSRGKKRQSSSKNESINKKRKRIVIAESSEESSASEMEDIREPDSPEVPQVIEKIRSCPSPPLVKCEGGRRKIRKLIDKTFMNDDGYFVTQKEYIYESCSDKEDDVQVEVAKSVTAAEPAAKNTTKRKQATLLNFFKKS